jgi:hypothetical protein
MSGEDMGLFDDTRLVDRNKEDQRRLAHIMMPPQGSAGTGFVRGGSIVASPPHTSLRLSLSISFLHTLVHICFLLITISCTLLFAMI